MAEAFKNEILEVYRVVDARNRAIGWKRYDWSDLSSCSFLLNRNGRWYYPFLRKAVLGLDFLAPMFFHRLFSIQKQIVPSAFYHVGQASLLIEKELPELVNWENDRLYGICCSLLDIKQNARYVCWGHPYSHHALGWRDPNVKTVDSCAHHTARCGTLLNQVGIWYGNQEFVRSAVSCALALVEFHNWKEYEDGTCVVSYYPSTEDETINTCADVALLFAEIPFEYQDEKFNKLVNGITRMIVDEQHNDGSWSYCTKRFYSKTGSPPYSDNHHTGMVIQSLSRIILSGHLNRDLKARAIVALHRGIEFYISAFFDGRGRAYYFPNRNDKMAPVTAYGEALAAMYWAIKISGISDKVKSYIKCLVPKLIKTMIEFVDKQGDVACVRSCFMKYQIQSLRWGSGPFLEGMAYALLLEKEGLVDF